MNTLQSRFFAALFLLLLLVPAGAFGQDAAEFAKSQLAKSEDPRFSHLKLRGDDFPPPLRIVSNPAFQVGEKLEYIVRYGPIVAGHSRLSVPEMVLYEKNPSYRILSEAWSNSFFSRFYKVDDRVESITDARGIFSWHFTKRLREGRFKQDISIEYDQRNQLSYVNDDTVKTVPFVLDVLAAMYYIRTQPLAPGDTLYIDNQDNNKIYPLMVVVHGREKIKIKAGTFNCLVVQPFLKEPGLFKQKGNLIVHMTDDQRKIPVKMTSQIYVSKFNLGAVVAELVKMEGTLDSVPRQPPR